MGRNKGFTVSQETRDKISASLTGRPKSEEAKANMNEKRKGKQPALGHKKTPEAIKKIRDGNLGQKRSDVTKALISAAQKRRYGNGK